MAILSRRSEEGATIQLSHPRKPIFIFPPAAPRVYK